MFDNNVFAREQGPKVFVRERSPKTQALEFAPRFRRSAPPSGSTNIALGGVVLSVPFGFAAFVGLLVYEVALVPALLLASGLQAVMFCGVLVVGLLQQARAPKQGQAALAQDDRTAEAASIWWMYPRQFDTGNQLRAAMIAPDVLHSRRMAAELTAHDYEIHQCSDPGVFLARMQARPCDWDLLIFDTDSAADLESAVDHLIEFRELCPGTSVVLISSSARYDEFNSERRAICDVTLAKPVHNGRLLDAVKFSTAAKRVG